MFGGDVECVEELLPLSVYDVGVGVVGLLCLVMCCSSVKTGVVAHQQDKSSQLYQIQDYGL